MGRRSRIWRRSGSSWLKLAQAGSSWLKLAPHRPFEYSFVDDTFGRLYRSDEQFGPVVGLFTSLAILVACLGLFGLASLTIQRRMKEIGVRKILGASTGRLLVLLTGEFTRLILLAIVGAAPLAYLLME